MEQLPLGWEAHREGDQAYYFHAASGGTQWERPSADDPLRELSSLSMRGL